MKTKPTNWTTLVVLVLVSCVIFGCTNKDNQKDLALARAEAIIRADSIMWSNILDPDEKSTKAILDEEVDTTFANLCIRGFKTWYDLRGSINAETLDSAFTEAVAFKGHKLKKWLRSVGGLKKGAEVRVFFGVYTEEALDYAVKAEYINMTERKRLGDNGRLTVILRAYKNGSLALMPKSKKPLPSYNLGNLKP